MKKTLTLFLLVMAACSKPSSESADTDSTAYNPIDSATSDPVLEYIDNAGIIDYWDDIDDSLEIALATFEPLNEVRTASAKAIYFKDSIEGVRQTYELKDPADTMLFDPHFKEAFRTITAYKNLMMRMSKPSDPTPRLTDLNRKGRSEKDKTMEYLPSVERSSYLTDNDFFFMGGAPFIDKLEGVHEGPNGPERRFSISVPDNANYLFNSLFNHRGGPIKVSYGPALDSYESGPQSIYGIGSLKHDFVERVAVLFLTDEGAIPAELLSVEIKLVPEGLGCISDQPLFIFACSAEVLEASNILGIYIPYGPDPGATWTVRYLNNSLWTADLNDDGIPDLAAVEGTFSGAMGDGLAEVLWFANINGEWRVIDAGRTLDCT